MPWSSALSDRCFYINPKTFIVRDEYKNTIDFFFWWNKELTNQKSSNQRPFDQITWSSKRLSKILHFLKKYLRDIFELQVSIFGRSTHALWLVKISLWSKKKINQSVYINLYGMNCPLISLKHCLNDVNCCPNRASKTKVGQIYCQCVIKMSALKRHNFLRKCHPIFLTAPNRKIN